MLFADFRLLQETIILSSSCSPSTVKAILIFFMVLMVTACASPTKLENSQTVEIDNNLAQLKQWALRGKIAWIAPNQRKSAYINWTQDSLSIQFTLSNVLGIQLANMTYDGSMATLSANDNTYTDTSPSALIAQTTGWHVPILDLQYWIKGAVNRTGRAQSNQHTAIESVQRYENGLIKQITTGCDKLANNRSTAIQQGSCAQWTIDYQAYAPVILKGIAYQLPKSIELTKVHGSEKIKIQVNQWK